MPKYTRKIWNPAEDKLLKKHYPNMYSIDVAKLLNCSIDSVYNRANKIGLKKSAAFRKMELGKQAQRLKASGVAHRFSKGNIPANKGKKMSDKQYAKCQATMFKKGLVPHNAKEKDGEISVRKDSNGNYYQYIRLSLGKWELLHRVMWQEKYGPIPEEMIVVFKDGNQHNCIIENLELITRSEHLYRNRTSFLNRDPQTKQTINLINKINKKVKQHGKYSNT